MITRRKSNVELLRSILAVMVITLHFNNPTMPGGGGAAALIAGQPSFKLFFINLSESLSCCAVNCFLIISGYFLINRNSKISDAIILIKKILLYNIICYVIIIFLQLEKFSLSTAWTRVIPTNYYVTFYTVIIIFSPYINLLVHNLTIEKYRALIFSVIIVFSIYPTVLNYCFDLWNVSLPGINTFSIDGDSAGYNIVHFLAMYLIGGYIRRQELEPTSNKQIQLIKKIFNKPANGFMVFFLIALFLALMNFVCKSTYFYNNIFVVIEAIALFVAFLKLNIDYNRHINNLAKYSFDVFLIHTNTLFMYYFWGMFKIADTFITLSNLKAVAFSVSVIIIMYLVCLFVAVMSDFFVFKRIR